MMTKGKAKTWYPWKTRNVVIAAENAVDEIQAGSVVQAVNDVMALSDDPYSAKPKK
jgi:hypothetical protein